MPNTIESGWFLPARRAARCQAEMLRCSEVLPRAGPSLVNWWSGGGLPNPDVGRRKGHEPIAMPDRTRPSDRAVRGVSLGPSDEIRHPRDDRPSLGVGAGDDPDSRI